jgi:hypothetical protein
VVIRLCVGLEARVLEAQSWRVWTYAWPVSPGGNVYMSDSGEGDVDIDICLTVVKVMLIIMTWRPRC